MNRHAFEATKVVSVSTKPRSEPEPLPRVKDAMAVRWARNAQNSSIVGASRPALLTKWGGLRSFQRRARRGNSESGAV